MLEITPIVLERAKKFNLDPEIIAAYDEWFFTGGAVSITPEAELGFTKWTEQHYPEVYKKIIERNHA